MSKPIAAGGVVVGLVLFASAFFASSFAGDQKTNDPSVVVEATSVGSTGAALDAETRGVLEKLVVSLKEDVDRLQQEKMAGAAAAKLASIRALESFLHPEARRAVIFRRDAIAQAVVPQRGAEREPVAAPDDERGRMVVIQRAEAALKTAAENVEIQRLQNEAEIATANARLDLAQLDLEKYSEGDYVLETNLIEGEIKLTQEDLTRALERLEAIREAAGNEAGKQSAVEVERINVKKAEITVAIAREKQKLLQQFSHKCQLAALKFNIAERARQRQLAMTTGQIQLARVQRALDLAKLELDLANTKSPPARK